MEPVLRERDEVKQQVETRNPQLRSFGTYKCRIIRRYAHRRGKGEGKANVEETIADGRAEASVEGEKLGLGRVGVGEGDDDPGARVVGEAHMEDVAHG